MGSKKGKRSNRQGRGNPAPAPIAAAPERKGAKWMLTAVGALLIAAATQAINQLRPPDKESAVWVICGLTSLAILLFVIEHHRVRDLTRSRKLLQWLTAFLLIGGAVWGASEWIDQLDEDASGFSEH